jgi:hypothetical protein
VRPASLQCAAFPQVQAAESQTAEKISAGHTGNMPMFRCSNAPFLSFVVDC